VTSDCATFPLLEAAAVLAAANADANAAAKADAPPTRKGKRRGAATV
jgi:hypothetical protein